LTLRVKPAKFNPNLAAFGADYEVEARTEAGPGGLPRILDSTGPFPHRLTDVNMNDHARP
jgi:hypothetical protein